MKRHVKDQTQNRRDAACCVRNGCKGYMPSGRCTQRPYKLFGYRQSLTYTAALQIRQHMEDFTPYI